MKSIIKKIKKNKEIFFTGKRIDNGEEIKGRSIITLIDKGKEKRFMLKTGDAVQTPFYDDYGNCFQITGKFYLVDSSTINIIKS